MKQFTLCLGFLLLICVQSLPVGENDSTGFIVNGRDADIRDFPHHLGLFDQGRFFCGAAVISRLFALTAAHCLDLNTPPEFVNVFYLNLKHDIYKTTFNSKDKFVGRNFKSHLRRSLVLCERIPFASTVQTHNIEHQPSHLGL